MRVMVWPTDQHLTPSAIIVRFHARVKGRSGWCSYATYYLEDEA